MTARDSSYIHSAFERAGRSSLQKINAKELVELQYFHDGLADFHHHCSD